MNKKRYSLIYVLFFLFTLLACSKLDFSVKNFLPSSENSPQELQKQEISFSSDALALIAEFNAKGFRCSENDLLKSLRGVVCVGSFRDYPQPVRFYVSPYYQQSENKNHIHFHGHRLQGVDTFETHAADLEGWGDYGAELVTSQFKGLLIIPESIGNCETYEKYFVSEFEFQDFVNDLEFFQSQQASSVSLSGHSGAYRILNRMAGFPAVIESVHRLGLLDAIYSTIPHITNWINGNENNDLRIYYVIGNKSGTETHTQNFIKTLSEYAKEYLTIKGVAPAPLVDALSAHMSIVRDGNFADILH